jgi:N-acetylglutamate synthase-like GNAT family acetyltransferase
MIIHKNLIDLDENIKLKINNFILLYFSNSRLDTYESVLYDIDNNTQEILGFLGLQTCQDNISIINQLCVDVKCRNQGIASSLLKYIENTLHTNMILYIDKNTISTDNLYNYYTKRGFIAISSNLVEYKMFKSINIK